MYPPPQLGREKGPMTQVHAAENSGTNFAASVLAEFSFAEGHPLRQIRQAIRMYLGKEKPGWSAMMP